MLEKHETGPPGASEAPATFKTQRLQLAIFLHATGRLTLERCELSGNGKVDFIFADPAHVAAQAELDFELGATVSASSLFASQTYLRRKMSEALKNRRMENHGNCSN